VRPLQLQRRARHPLWASASVAICPVVGPAAGQWGASTAGHCCSQAPAENPPHPVDSCKRRPTPPSTHAGSTARHWNYQHHRSRTVQLGHSGGVQPRRRHSLLPAAQAILDRRTEHQPPIGVPETIALTSSTWPRSTASSIFPPIKPGLENNLRRLSAVVMPLIPAAAARFGLHAPLMPMLFVRLRFVASRCVLVCKLALSPLTLPHPPQSATASAI